MQGTRLWGQARPGSGALPTRDRTEAEGGSPGDTGGTPTPGTPSPAHLLMYSAFSCFPQVLHLKQPKCQCLSKATRDWPFLISVPQPPQPGRKVRTGVSSLWAEGSGGLLCWVPRRLP